jgi:hypothetical protein
MTPEIACAVVFGLLVIIGVAIIIYKIRKMTKQTMEDVGDFAVRAAESESKRADAALVEVAELRSEAEEIKKELEERHEAEKGKHDAVDRADDHAGVDSVIFDERR